MQQNNTRKATWGQIWPPREGKSKF